MMYRSLNNGVQMPILGFGVFQIQDPEVCTKAVLDAIDVGYRLIDTAQSYGNEEAVGKALSETPVAREDLFITTKIWISEYGYEKAKASLDASLKRLQLDYIDLVLLHQPFGDTYGAYRALEEYYKAGKLRAIGVSNFYPDRLADMVHFNETKPQLNQVEAHPFHQQEEARVLMEKLDVQMQAWAPFAEGKNDLFTNDILTKIGKAHQKTAAQVTLRFLIQRGIAVIPKTVSKDRMQENFDVFDFELSKEEMDLIRTLDTGTSLFFSHQDPDTVERFAGFTRTF